jgi:hypothetical protein
MSLSRLLDAVLRLVVDGQFDMVLWWALVNAMEWCVLVSLTARLDRAALCVVVKECTQLVAAAAATLGVTFVCTSGCPSMDQAEANVHSSATGSKSAVL